MVMSGGFVTRNISRVIDHLSSIRTPVEEWLPTALATWRKY